MSVGKLLLWQAGFEDDRVHCDSEDDNGAADGVLGPIAEDAEGIREGSSLKKLGGNGAVRGRKEGSIGALSCALDYLEPAIVSPLGLVHLPPSPPPSILGPMDHLEPSGGLPAE